MSERQKPRKPKDHQPVRRKAKQLSASVDNELELEKARDYQAITSGTHADVRPSHDDHCAECGQAVGDSWVSYRPDPANLENLIQHFGGIVNAGPAEPPVARPEPRTRDFRYPDDVGVFFHSWCAPRVELPEKLQKESTEILAEALVAHYRRTEERWAKVRLPIPTEDPPPRCHAQVASVDGRRVFTMARAEWGRFRSHEGQLIEIELERTPPGGLAEPASAIAALAAQCHVGTERIEVWHIPSRSGPDLSTYRTIWSS